MLLSACRQNNLATVQQELTKLARSPDDLIHIFERDWIPAVKYATVHKFQMDPRILQEFNAFIKQLNPDVVEHILYQFYYHAARGNTQTASDFLGYGLLKHHKIKLKMHMETLLIINPTIAILLQPKMKLSKDELAEWALDILFRMHKKWIPTNTFHGLLLTQLLKQLPAQQCNLLFMELADYLNSGPIDQEIIRAKNNYLSDIYPLIANCHFLGFKLKDYFNKRTFNSIDFLALMHGEPAFWVPFANLTLAQKLQQPEMIEALDLLLTKYRMHKSLLSAKNTVITLKNGSDFTIANAVNEHLNIQFSHLSNSTMNFFITEMLSEPNLLSFLKKHKLPSSIVQLDNPFYVDLNDEQIDEAISDAAHEISQRYPHMISVEENQVVKDYLAYQLKCANFLHLSEVLSAQPKPVDRFSELRRKALYTTDPVIANPSANLLHQFERLSLSSDPQITDTASTATYTKKHLTQKKLAKSQ